MMLTFWLLVAPEVVVMTTTGVNCDTTVVIMFFGELIEALLSSNQKHTQEW